MSDGTTVTVVIPTRNRASMLARALRSIDIQTLTDSEVIVIDDASTDSTSQVLSQMTGIRVLSNDQRIGAAAARNQGIMASSGDYIAFLDSDDEYLPTKLAQQAQFLSAHQAVGAVYCRHIAVDDRTGQRRNSRGGMYRGWIQPILLAGRCPHTTSLFMVRKAALLECGGFDEGLPGFQDTDLWIRMSAIYPFDYIDEALVAVHAHDGTRLTTNIDERVRAVDAFLAKWGPEMEAVAGPRAVQRYRVENLAVAQGSRVLERVDKDTRRAAIKELGVYFKIAGFSRPRQLAGLVVAVVLGPGAHRKLKLLLTKS